MYPVLAHMYSETNTQNKKERQETREKLERQWLMNWTSSVFPTCQTAESINLSSKQTGFNTEKTRLFCDDVWPFLTHQTLFREAGRIAIASSLRLQTQLNNQGFNCCIIPQSINRGFVGYLDEFKQIPQETNTENLSVKQMRRPWISWGWE